MTKKKPTKTARGPKVKTIDMTSVEKFLEDKADAIDDILKRRKQLENSDDEIDRVTAARNLLRTFAREIETRGNSMEICPQGFQFRARVIKR